MRERESAKESLVSQEGNFWRLLEEEFQYVEEMLLSSWGTSSTPWSSTGHLKWVICGGRSGAFKILHGPMSGSDDWADTLL